MEIITDVEGKDQTENMNIMEKSKTEDQDPKVITMDGDFKIEK